MPTAAPSAITPEAFQRFSNMIFKETVVLLLLQHLLLSYREALLDHKNPLKHSIIQDKAALLEFKNSIQIDPNSTLANWNEDNYVCNFTGVTCGLRVLELVNNQIFGNIPPEFSSLRHLRYLKLDENNLNGSIPDNLAGLINLTVITIKGNRLTGTLPRTFFSNCTLLRNIDLSGNNLTGNIPMEIGDCPNLWTLNLYNNQFTGILPLSLRNASQMFNLDVEYNNLSGELPSEIVSNWPDLRNLHLSYNIMVSHVNNTNLDPFFAALVNGTTDMFELELAGMRLGGRLPNSIGQLGVSLYSLSLEENCIYGSIPTSLANLSKLSVLNLTDNLLNGAIPTEISHLPHLQQLFLSNNSFAIEIPEAFGYFPTIGLLDLSYNKFSGQIPRSLGNLVQLKELLLNNNQLSGTIPSSLGQCKDMDKLDLSYNRLTGNIPPEILNLLEMRNFLNFSHNHLEGPLPFKINKLEKIEEIDLSFNNFSGSIISEISSCIALRTLDLSNNSLQGTLPDSLGDLRNLESVDLSGNNLSGKIPQSLAKIQTLSFLDLSYNHFDGEIPSGGVFGLITNLSFIGNDKLCGVSVMKSCSGNSHWFHSRKFLIISSLVISVSAFLLTIVCVLGYRRFRGMNIPTNNAETETETTPTPDIIHNIPRITYRELSEATGAFDSDRLIGTGGFGRVYKGILPDGTIIAVKVLQLQTGNSTKSFNRECQVLKRIRHRNLIRIITACSLPDFKALVLPFMANGSLDNRLYPHSETQLGSGSSDLSLLQRVNICSDIAEGMAYLHHHSPVRVIHCDLKPSNVLLNDDMTALVSDFGIARLVMTVGMGNAGVVENIGNSTANILCGSIGYIAPEYGFGSITSTKGDVYSFGIVVLEMVTRKRPTDDMFVGGLSLPKWVKTHCHGKVEKVIDSSLARTKKDQSPEVKKMWEVAIGELIELGILCTQESPSTRPTMLDAADDLDRLKRYLNGDTTATFASSLGISSSTLGDD